MRIDVARGMKEITRTLGSKRLREKDSRRERKRDNERTGER